MALIILGSTGGGWGGAGTLAQTLAKGNLTGGVPIDAAAALELGTVSATSVTIGRTGQAVAVDGNLTVNGTTTVINSVNLAVADRLLLISDGADPGVTAGFAVERGATGGDALLFWNEVNDRFEIGYFDTVGGTVVPSAALANGTLADVRVKNLTLDGDAGYATITAQPSTGSASTGLGLISTGSDALSVLNLGTQGATRWQVTSVGDLTTLGGNFDIGSVSDSTRRPGNVYATTSYVINSPGQPTLTITNNALTHAGSAAFSILQNGTGNLVIDAGATAANTVEIRGGSLPFGLSGTAGGVSIFGGLGGGTPGGSGGSVSVYGGPARGGAPYRGGDGTLAGGQSSSTAGSSPGDAVVVGGNSVAGSGHAGGNAYVDGGVGDATPGQVFIGTKVSTVKVTVGTSTMTNGVLVESGGLIALYAYSNGISLQTFTTGNININPAGALNLGTNSVAHEVSIGSATGGSGVNIVTGTGGIDIGINAVAATINIGNTTGATALNLDAGSGGIRIGSSGVVTDFPSGSTVDFTGATITGLAWGLSSVLAAGNTTGANDILVSNAGQQIRGSSAAQGIDLTLIGGSSISGGNAGGGAYLGGGGGDGAGAGGSTTVIGGTGGATNGAGGLTRIRGGTAVGSGAGGGLQLEGGTSPSGTHGSVSIFTAGTARWAINASGHLISGAGSDNVYDFGAPGATRPRTIYLGTSLNVGNGITPSADNGDIVAGDGTRQFFFDSSAAIVRSVEYAALASPSVTSFYGARNGSAQIIAHASDASGFPIIKGMRSRGTLAAQTTVGGTDTLLKWTAEGYNGSAYVTMGAVDFRVDGTVTAGVSHPNSIVFSTVKSGEISCLDRWQINNAGHLQAWNDNVYDFGASGATRPRTGYFGTSLNVGSGFTVSTASGDFIAGSSDNRRVWYDESAGSLNVADNVNGSYAFTVYNSAASGDNEGALIQVANPLHSPVGGITPDYRPVLRVSHSNTGFAQGVGAGVVWTAFNGTNGYQQCFVQGYKENGTNGSNLASLTFGTNGGGSATDVKFRWKITSGGHFQAYNDNVYNIGDVGANRPSTLYLGTGGAFADEAGTNGFRAAYFGSKDAASTNNVNFGSGNASAGNSGNVVLDAGTATGTKGTVSVGATSASSVTIGNSGATVSLTSSTATWSVIASAAYTPTNVTTDRTYDANATTLDEVADVLGTLIADLQSAGILA